MYRNGFVERVGTEDMFNKCHQCGLRTPESIQEESFSSYHMVCQQAARGFSRISPPSPRRQGRSYLQASGTSVRQVRKTIDALRNDGIIWRKGGGKTGTRVVTDAEAEEEKQDKHI